MFQGPKKRGLLQLGEIRYLFLKGKLQLFVGGAGYWVEAGGGGPQVGAQAAGPPAIAGGAHEGGRAFGVAGAFIGALLATSALVWALYKFKV